MMKRLLILLVIILSMAQICSGVPVLQDHYNESDGVSPDIRAGIQDYHWEAQTFTANQDYIIQSVKFHNAFSVPKSEKEETIFFIKLIRDADKLDIWRVFLEYYESGDDLRASAVSLGLPNLRDYSKNVLSYIFEKRIVPLLTVKTLNDFKLLQLSWIYDLNFEPSFRLLSERKYMERIVSHLPKDKDISKPENILRDYIEQRMRKKHPSSNY